jgi:hypothetical protein
MAQNTGSRTATPATSAFELFAPSITSKSPIMWVFFFDFKIETNNHTKIFYSLSVHHFINITTISTDHKSVWKIIIQGECVSE